MFGIECIDRYQNETDHHVSYPIPIFKPKYFLMDGILDAKEGICSSFIWKNVFEARAGDLGIADV